MWYDDFKYIRGIEFMAYFTEPEMEIGNTKGVIVFADLLAIFS